MLREATYPPAAVNVLDVSSESMAAFQVILYGRFWVFTEARRSEHRRQPFPQVNAPMNLFHCYEVDDKSEEYSWREAPSDEQRSKYDRYAIDREKSHDPDRRAA